MFLHMSTMFLLPLLLLLLLPVLVLLPLLCSSCEGIKVISTNPEVFLPDKSGQATILNSSLQDLTEWSLCARFKTFHFSTYGDITPFQTVIATGGVWMLAGFAVLPCDRNHQGVAQYSTALR